MFVLALLVNSLLTQVDAGSGTASCPAPFVKIGDGCYYYSLMYTTWSVARTTCQGLLPGEDSDLAVLDTNCDDFRHIASYAATNGLQPFWVGANDEFNQGYWMWVDGRQVDITAPYWNTDEPSGDAGEDCLYLSFHSEIAHRLRLKSDSCTDIWPFLCQLGVHALK